MPMIAVPTLAAALLLCQSPTAQVAAGTPLPPNMAKFDGCAPSDWHAALATSDEPIHVALAGDVDWICDTVPAQGGRVIMRTASVVTAILPKRGLAAMAADARLERIGDGHLPRAASGAAPAEAKAPPAFAASAVPLRERPFAAVDLGLETLDPQTRPTGAGVVVACVESAGMPDFRHPDFRTGDGRTRFDVIWDQRTGPMEIPAGADAARGAPFGTVYERETLDALLADKAGGGLVFGEASVHPTNSVSVAAGNGGALGAHCGAAPESTLVAVTALLDEPSLIEAVDFAFRRADALGMPCVVNLSQSLGVCRGVPMDGRDLLSIALTEMVRAKPGRVIVSSAGNNDHLLQHAKISIPGRGPVRTGRYWAFSTQLHYQLATNALLFRTDSSPSLRARVSLAVPNAEKGLDVHASTPWFSLVDSLARGPVEYDLTRLRPDGTGQQSVGVVPHHRGPEYSSISLEFTKTPSTKRDSRELYVVEFDGVGTVDAWSSMGVIMVQDMESAPAARPRDYVECDGYYSVDSPASAAGVIAVGASVNTDTFERDPAFVAPARSPTGNEEPGRVTSYTQRGGIMQGTWKPLLVVCGHNVPAAVPLDSEPEDGLKGGMHGLYTGTSSASPVLAGVCALYLQQHPQATAADVVDALRQACFEDGATGPTPNPKVGYGKLDASRLLRLPAGKAPAAGAPARSAASVGAAATGAAAKSEQGRPRAKPPLRHPVDLIGFEPTTSSMPWKRSPK